ncbi:MAG: hypothetical protein KA764_16805 [Anaerolineales bacterium]|nr:hypothetical protein [Anaerolineales bacterium]
MLKGLRWRLTSLFLLAGVGLILMVSLGAYGLVGYYFQSTTDLALQRKMALGLAALGHSLPDELVEADQVWAARRPTLLVPTASSSDDGEAEDDGLSHSDEAGARSFYDTDLAPIYLVALDRHGQSITLAGTTQNAPADGAAAAAALADGTDWRTVTFNGTRFRLLTYRLETDQVLQAGRALTDQDQVLSLLMLGLLGIGLASLVMLGLGSWWLAGRSLRPAQQAWARQQTFIANASHELRTPLTLMRASAEVAQRGLPEAGAAAAAPALRGLLDDILGECDHMSRLVNDLLLLSRLDAGKLPLELTEVPVAGLLEDAGRQIGRVAQDRGLVVQVQAAPGAVRADATRLRQVLLILLDNAVRHTPAGGRIQMTAEPAGRHITLVVSDTGSGIAPEHLPRLFERFYRADSARGREAGGAGLGLAIAKSLIEAHHGRLHVASRPGQGTQVSLTLPRA